PVSWRPRAVSAARKGCVVSARNSANASETLPGKSNARKARINDDKSRFNHDGGAYRLLPYYRANHCWVSRVQTTNPAKLVSTLRLVLDKDKWVETNCCLCLHNRRHYCCDNRCVASNPSLAITARGKR